MRTEHKEIGDRMSNLATHVAGLSSVLQGKVTGISMEPPIQRRKRAVRLPSNPLVGSVDSSGKEFILLGNQRKFAVNVPYKLLTAKSKSREKLVDIPAQTADEVVDLCQASKLQPTAPVTRFDTGKALPKKTSKTASKRVSPCKSQTKRRGASSTPRKNRKSVNLKPPTANDENSENNGNINEGKTEHNQNANCNNSDNGVIEAEKGDINEIQGSVDIDERLEYVMKHRAGLAPKRSHGGQRRSEYQKMFVWRKCPRSTPILAANQVIYNNNTEMAPDPAKVIPSPSSTEYRSQFKSWASSKRRLHPETNHRASGDGSHGNESNNSNSHSNNNNNNNNNANAEMESENTSDIGIDNALKGKATNKEASKSCLPCKAVDTVPVAGLPSKTVHEPMGKQTLQSPESPVKSSPLSHIVWNSEYSSNYQPFTRFSYDQGVWKGARSPHKRAESANTSADVKSTVQEVSRSADTADTAASTNWFAEVRELREKAQEYRLRARGMHFSREHVGQLLAKQTKLWDEQSVTSTMSALSLNNADKPQQSEDFSQKSEGMSAPPDVKEAGTHRLAWSCDGSKPTSDADSVRSIRSDHSTEALCTESQDSARSSDDKSASSVASAVDPANALQSAVADPIVPVEKADCTECSKEEEGAIPQSPVAAGKPTLEKHELEEEIAADVTKKSSTLKTRHKHCPGNIRSNKPGLGMLLEGGAETYNVPLHKRLSSTRGGDNAAVDREDGAGLRRTSLSSSMLSVASTTSTLVSELLERAEKRRKEFWGAHTAVSRRSRK